VVQHGCKAAAAYLLSLQAYLLFSRNTRLLKSDPLLKNLSQLKLNY
jgi:hypothetical protein